MSEGQANVPEDAQVVQEPNPVVPEAPEPHMIRVGHTDSGLVGPFVSREQAEQYLAAKRKVATDDKWEEGRVEIITLAAARRAKEEAEARALMGR